MYGFVGAGCKPARYGNGSVMKNDEALNERGWAGCKPAPTKKHHMGRFELCRGGF
jgi:hypothetical protein